MQGTRHHWQACQCLMYIQYYISGLCCDDGGVFGPPWLMDFLISSPDTCLGFVSESESESYYHNHSRHFCWHHGEHRTEALENQVVLFSAWQRTMLVTSGMETKPFRQAVLFQRELDQNRTKRYCVMCSSLFCTTELSNRYTSLTCCWESARGGWSYFLFIVHHMWLCEVVSVKAAATELWQTGRWMLYLFCFSWRAHSAPPITHWTVESGS